MVPGGVWEALVDGLITVGVGVFFFFFFFNKGLHVRICTCRSVLCVWCDRRLRGVSMEGAAMKRKSGKRVWRGACMGGRAVGRVLCVCISSSSEDASGSAN